MVDSLVDHLPAILAAITGILCWIGTRRVNSKIDANTEITKETQKSVNGRMDQFMTVSNEAAHARGKAEGVISEQQRQSLFGKVLVQQAAERTNKMMRLNNSISGLGPVLPVLVVEDNEIDAMVLCKILPKFNLRCETVASNANDALEKLQSNTYGAIFADLELHCDISRKGELIQSLMRAAPTTPVFVVTGYIDDWVVNGMKVLGVMATISKPATEEKLAAVLNNLSNLSL